MPAEPELSLPFVTAGRQVPAEWTDYNGHMNESRYGQMFSDAADGIMRMIGSDEAYVARGMSWFTVEIHIRYLDEAMAGDALEVTTQVLDGKGKKMHLFHRLIHADGRLLATGEQLLLHVDMKARKTCDPAPEVSAKLRAIAEAQASLPVPEGAGRSVGQKA